jgi:hypothetical protein
MSWLLLIHQLPPKPAYLRVKIWRRLQALGAVAVKNSVYALPRSEQALEDFQWVVREIAEGGGEGAVCEAHFVEGLSDVEVTELFRSAREGDYAQLAEEARAAVPGNRASAALGNEQRAELAAHIKRLKRQFGRIVAIDFFAAPNRETTQALIAELEERLAQPLEDQRAARAPALAKLSGRTWVTREGIKIDRIASAWLIRRFLDPKARFKFVASRGYRPKRAELRFDMFDAEFTHEGDQCTFEVLLARSGLQDPALRQLAEIVHDIDLKDGKYGREEAAGVARLIDGLAITNKKDGARLDRGSSLFDDLYENFRQSERSGHQGEDKRS